MELWGRIARFLHLDDILKVAQEGVRQRPVPTEQDTIAPFVPKPSPGRAPLRIQLRGKPIVQPTQPPTASLRVRIGGKPVTPAAPKPDEVLQLPGEVRQQLGLQEPKETPLPFAKGLQVVRQEAREVAQTIAEPLRQTAQEALQVGTATIRALAIAHLRTGINDWEEPADKDNTLQMVGGILRWTFEKEGLPEDEAQKRVENILSPYRSFLTQRETEEAIYRLQKEYIAQGLEPSRALTQAYRAVMRSGAAMPLFEKAIAFGRAAAQNVRDLFEYWRKKNESAYEYDIYAAHLGSPIVQKSATFALTGGEIAAAAMEPLTDMAADTGLPGTVGALMRPLLPLSVIPTYLASRWRGEKVSVGEIARRLADPQEPLDNMPMLMSEAYQRAYRATGSKALGVLAGVAGLAGDALLDISSIVGGILHKTTAISAQTIKQVRWADILQQAVREKLITPQLFKAALAEAKAFGADIVRNDLVVDLAAGTRNVRDDLALSLARRLNNVGIDESSAAILGRALVEQAAADLQPGWRIRNLPWPLPAQEQPLRRPSLVANIKQHLPELQNNLDELLNPTKDEALRAKILQATQDIVNNTTPLELAYNDWMPNTIAQRILLRLKADNIAGVTVEDVEKVIDEFVQSVRIAPSPVAYAKVAANTALMEQMGQRLQKAMRPAPRLPDVIAERIISQAPERLRRRAEFYAAAAKYVAGEAPMPQWPIHSLPQAFMVSSEATRYMRQARSSTKPLFDTLRQHYRDVVETLKEASNIKKINELEEAYPFLARLRFALFGQGPMDKEVQETVDYMNSILHWTLAEREAQSMLETNLALQHIMQSISIPDEKEANAINRYLAQQQRRLEGILERLKDGIEKLSRGEEIKVSPQMKDAVRYHLRLKALNDLRGDFAEALQFPAIERVQNRILTMMDGLNKFWEALGDFENPLVAHLDLTGEMMLLSPRRAYPNEVKAAVANDLARNFRRNAERLIEEAQRFEEDLRNLFNSGLNGAVFEAMERTMRRQLSETPSLAKSVKMAINLFRPYYAMLPSEEMRNSFIMGLERAETYYNTAFKAIDDIFRGFSHLSDIDCSHAYMFVNLRQAHIGRGKLSEGLEIPGGPAAALQYLINTYLGEFGRGIDAGKYVDSLGRIDWRSLEAALPQYQKEWQRIRDVARLGERIIGFHKDIWNGHSYLQERGLPSYSEIYNFLRQLRGLEPTTGLGDFYMHSSYFAPPEWWQILASATGEIPVGLQSAAPFRIFTQPAEYVSAINALIERVLQLSERKGRMSDIYPLMNARLALLAYVDDIYANMRTYETYQWLRRWFPKEAELSEEEAARLYRAGWSVPAALVDSVPEAADFIVSPEANLALAYARASVERFYNFRNALLNNAFVRTMRVWPLMSPFFQLMQVAENFLYNPALASRFISLPGYMRGIIAANKVLARMLTRPFDAEFVGLDGALRRIFGNNLERMANIAEWTDAQIGGLFEWLWWTMTSAVRNDVRRTMEGYAAIASRRRQQIEALTDKLMEAMHRFPVIETAAPAWARIELIPLRDVLQRQGAERAKEFAHSLGLQQKAARRFADALNSIWFGFDVIGRTILYASLIASGETPETARNILTHYSVEYSPHMYSTIESMLQGIMWYLRYPYHRLQQLPTQLQENPQMVLALMRAGRLSMGGRNVWPAYSDRAAAQLYSEEDGYQYTPTQILALVENLPYPAQAMSNFMLLPPQIIDMRDYQYLRDYRKATTGFGDVLFFMRVPLPALETMADISGLSTILSGDMRGLRQVAGSRLVPPLRAMTGEFPPPQEEPGLSKAMRYMPVPTWLRLLTERAQGRERLPFRFDTESAKNLISDLQQGKRYLFDVSHLERLRLLATQDMERMAQQVNNMRIGTLSIYALPMERAFMAMSPDEKALFLRHTLEMRAQGEPAGNIDVEQAIFYALRNAKDREEREELLRAFREHISSFPNVSFKLRNILSGWQK